MSRDMSDRTRPRPGSKMAAMSGISLALLCSGAAGLIYQAVWTRQLMLMLGAQAQAVSLSLSVFFLGLAAGSAWGGRIADRSPRPFLMYALLEGIVCAWGLALPWISRAADWLAIILLPAGDAGSLQGLLSRIPPAVTLVLVPAVCMGATLPLAIRGFTAGRMGAGGGAAGWLYGINTLGAMGGSLAAVFLGAPLLGYRGTALAAATLNAAAAGLGILAQRSSPAACACQPSSPDLHLPAPPGRVALCAAAFAVSGFAMLGLEVIWTRLLAMVFLGTVYAFAVMLAALLGALAAGGWFGGILARASRDNALGAVGGLLCLLGLTVCLQLYGFARLPEWFAASSAQTGSPREALVMFTWTLLIVGPAAFLSGAVFPLLAAAAAGGNPDRTGHSTGVLLGANTFGGVLGALAGGFAALPLLGAHRGMLALAMLPFLAGLVLTFACGCLPVKRRLFTAGLYLLALALSLRGAPRDVMDTVGSWYIPPDHETIFFREGSEATVAVSQPRGQQDGHDRVLWINRVQATTSIERGVRMNRFQGALPLLFDRDPREALFMCFGSGITCGTLAIAGFDHIDAVEIAPEVYEAAPLFAADNLDVMRRDNVRFIVGDGRHYLKTARKQYDFISFEPMPLAMAGVINFYTEEYYRLCLSRLRPGGMVSQWIPLHSLGNPVVASLFGTFLQVFPHVMVFHVNADLFLIGSNAPLKLDPDRAAQRLAGLPELRAALGDVQLADPVELTGSCVIAGAPPDLPEPLQPLRLPYGMGWPPSTETPSRSLARKTALRDDWPWVEYEAPRWIRENTVPDNLAWLESMISDSLGDLLAETADPEVSERIERRRRARRIDLTALRTLYRSLLTDFQAVDRFLDALRTDPEDPVAAHYLLQIARKQAELFAKWNDREKLESLRDRLVPHSALEPALRTVESALARINDDTDRTSPNTTGPSQ